MSATRRVLLLAGSAVDDFYCELSRLYAQDCLTATADPARYEFHVAYVTPDRRWRFPRDLTPAAISAAAPMSPAEAIARIELLSVDVMVPQMFCQPGMTTYRALFDLLGVPYLGNRPEVMATGANKARARALVSAAGVAVPAGEVVRHDQRPTMDPPVVVKPVDADNSMGLSLVRSHADYAGALGLAFEHSELALVESYVELGREVRCGVLELDGELVCLPLEEYRVDAAAPIRQVADKLARGEDGNLRLVAKDGARAWIVDRADPLTETVWTAARACHRALGCRDYSLFDFRIDPAGRPWFLEAGLYCSFARTSVISVMAAAAGIGLPELFGSLIQARIPVPGR